MNGKEILDALVQDITEQRFADDGRLPSEAALGDRFGVSRMTVRSALAELQRRGLIEKRNGSGSYLTAHARRKSGMIGLVIPDCGEFEFFNALREEISRHYKRLHYRVELVAADRSAAQGVVADVRHKVRRLAALRAEGVLFRPYVSPSNARENQEIVRILNHAEIPVVLIDADIVRPPARSAYDLVAVDNIAAGRRIAGHLRERGFGRIAFLTEQPDGVTNANWSNRLFGLAGELALLGAEEAVRTLAFAPDDLTALAAVLNGRKCPDAIVCGNDESACTLIRSLTALGVRVPDDMAVVGFDDGASARACVPPLTTVSQPLGQLAAVAFKQLLMRIRASDDAPRETYVAAPLVVRASTSP